MIQTRPFAGSTNWLAPFALESQMIAKAGEATGEGYAQAGANIAAGVGKMVQRKDRAKEVAREQANTDRQFGVEQQRLGMEQARIDAARREQHFTLLNEYGKGLKMQMDTLVQTDPNAEQSPEFAKLKQGYDSYNSSMQSLVQQELDAVKSGAHPMVDATGTPRTQAGINPAQSAVDAYSTKPDVPGTLDPLAPRKVLNNPDGSVSTTSSMSFEEDGQEVLIPTVVGGVRLSTKDAIDNYHKTGQHFGKFKDAASADAYAATMHDQQTDAMGLPRGNVQQATGGLGGASPQAVDMAKMTLDEVIQQKADAEAAKAKWEPMQGKSARARVEVAIAERKLAMATSYLTLKERDKANEDAVARKSAEDEARGVADSMEELGRLDASGGPGAGTVLNPDENLDPSYAKGLYSEQAKAAGETRRGEIIDVRQKAMLEAREEAAGRRHAITVADREAFAQESRDFEKAMHDETLDATAKREATKAHEASLKTRISEERAIADEAISTFNRINDPKRPLIGDGPGRYTHAESSDIYKRYQEATHELDRLMRQQATGEVQPAAPAGVAPAQAKDAAVAAFKAAMADNPKADAHDEWVKANKAHGIEVK